MHIAVDKKLLFSTKCQLKATILMMAAYYVFNVMYPSKIGATLEFI